MATRVNQANFKSEWVWSEWMNKLKYNLTLFWLQGVLYILRNSCVFDLRQVLWRKTVVTWNCCKNQYYSLVILISSGEAKQQMLYLHYKSNKLLLYELVIKFQLTHSGLGLRGFVIQVHLLNKKLHETEPTTHQIKLVQKDHYTNSKAYRPPKRRDYTRTHWLLISDLWYNLLLYDIAVLAFTLAALRNVCTSLSGERPSNTQLDESQNLKHDDDMYGMLRAFQCGCWDQAYL